MPLKRRNSSSGTVPLLGYKPKTKSKPKPKPKRASRAPVRDFCLGSCGAAQFVEQPRLERLQGILQGLATQLSTAYDWHLSELQGIESCHLRVYEHLGIFGQAGDHASAVRALRVLEEQLLSLTMQLHQGARARQGVTEPGALPTTTAAAPDAALSSKGAESRAAQAMAGEIMRTADRFCRNGQLSLAELHTYLPGTEHQGFLEWFSRSRRHARFDADKNGVIDRAELLEATEAFLQAGGTRPTRLRGNSKAQLPLWAGPKKNPLGSAKESTAAHCREGWHSGLQNGPGSCESLLGAHSAVEQALSPSPVPHHSNTVPQHSSPIPQHSSPIPQHSNTVPQHSSPIPQHSSPIPQHSNTVPQHSSPIPQHSNTVPQHSSPIPQHSSPIPQHSSPIPQHSSPNPQHSSTLQHSSSVQQHSSPNPQHSSTPQQSSSVQQHSSPIPQHSSAPQQSSSVQQHSSTTSQQHGTQPGSSLQPQALHREPQNGQHTSQHESPPEQLSSQQLSPQQLATGISSELREGPHSRSHTTPQPSSQKPPDFDSWMSSRGSLSLCTKEAPPRGLASSTVASSTLSTATISSQLQLFTIPVRRLPTLNASVPFESLDLNGDGVIDRTEYAMYHGSSP